MVDLKAKLSEELAQARLALGVPGAGLALVEAGEVTLEAGFGEADRSARRPVATATVFQAASLAKSVTAWAIITLVERGRLDLDAPVWRYQRRFRPPPSRFDADAVTPRRIMSHRAGLALADYPGHDPAAPHPGDDETLFGGTRDPLRLVAAPGGGFCYSGGGWTLLQLAIEEQTGRAFADVLQETVLRPLGMRQSTFAWSEALAARLATPHDATGAPIPDYRYTAQAAAGLYATAGDLARFLAAHTTGPGGEPSGRGVIAPESVAALLEPQAETGREDGLWARYGLGFELEPLGDGRRLFGHAGVNRGWRCRMAGLAEAGAGVVVLTNTDSGMPLVEATIAAWAGLLSLPLASA